ncbi:MAG: hypothetical protein LC750_00370 [Actinobacteria bacterium]|nr:hypothetical protein [Actinomycetota bacterium]
MLRIHSGPGITAITGTAEDVLATMFGPPQHDAHARQWHRIERRRRFEAEQPARQAAIRAFIDEAIADAHEQQAQRTAKDHNYNTAVIRQHLHRWEFGCFSDMAPDVRAVRIRQLHRALDIAVDHHGALAEAAE